MMNDRSAGRIVGAGLEPCKVKKQLQLRVQDPNLCKVEANKRKQQEPTGPTAGAKAQTCKVEPNNNKQQPTNHRTNEQEEPTNQ
jgi:hypothetical protein